MADYKGGRGKRAPYETVMYRIPAPIKPVVELIGHTYRLLVDGVADPNGEQLIRRVEDAVYATGYQPQLDSKDFDPDKPINNSELDALKLELAQVRSQLAAADQEVDILRIVQAKTDQALVQLVDKIDAQEKGYKNNGFSQGIKDIKQLAQKRGL